MRLAAKADLVGNLCDRAGVLFEQICRALQAHGVKELAGGLAN